MMSNDEPSEQLKVLDLQYPIIQHIYNLKGLNKKCPFYLGHHCFLVNALVLQSITKNKFRYAYRTFFKLALFCTLHECLNICATY